jgi:fucose permease
VTARRRAPLLLGLAYVAFVGLGLPDGLLGVAWPSMRASFGLPLDALGPLLVATTGGYVTSSFATGRLVSRLGVGALLAASCAAMGASLLGYATASAFGIVVGCGFGVGLGAGGIDAGLNSFAARHHSPRTLNWLHACYGIGAATGPLLMTSVLLAGAPWQRGYAVVAGFQLALALAFAATRSLWREPSPLPAGPAARPAPVASAELRVGRGPAGPPAAPVRATLRLAPAWLGMLSFFLYVGIEQSAGTWAYTFLTQARGVSMAAAGTWVSIFWGGLLAGRVSLGLVANRVPLDHMVRGALAGVVAAAVALALAPGPRASELALVGIAFACGPVFPSLIAATPRRLGAAHAGNAVGFQIAAAGLGQALLPWGVGALARRAGLDLLGPALVVLALVAVAVHEQLLRAARACEEAREAGAVALDRRS